MELKVIVRYLALGVFLLFVASVFATNNPPHVSVGTGVDKDKLSKEVKFYMDQLSLDSTVYIRINYSLALSETTNGTLEYKRINERIHQVVITINRSISSISQSLTLAHELVHVKQYVTGKLEELSPNSFLWNEKEEINLRQVAYHDRPWEIEAHDQSYELRKAYLSSETVVNL